MRRSQIGVFVSIVLAILGLAHLVVYKGVVVILGGTSLALQISFTLLWLSFIAMQFSVAKFNNLFTRVFYRVATSWLGFVVYLFLATVLYALASLVLQGEQLMNFGLVVFALAKLTAIYGLIHACRITVKKQEVVIPNLPHEWKSKKIVWVSDVHLGQIRGKGFATRVVAAINKLNPDLVLIGGDLYDGVSCDEVDIIEPFKDLQTTMGTFFVTGNHDGFSDKATSKDIAIIENAGMKVLKDQKVEIDGVQLVGVDYKHTAKRADFEKVLKQINIDRNKPSILLKHVPSDVDVAREAGISLQISGHTHHAQVWPFRFLPNMIYKGFSYGLKHSGATKVLVSSGVGTWGPPLRVATNSEILLINLV